MEKKEKKKRFKLENPWKLAFFMLIGILAGAVCLVGFRVTQEREIDNLAEQTSVTSSTPTFQVQLNKSQANQLINFYLDEYQNGSSVKYSFSLANQALLTGTFEVLGHELNFYLYFEPYLLENGDIELSAKSISIGNLSLPISELMKYVKSNFKMPSWVEVDASSEKLILHLSQFTFKNGITFRAEQIDLINDIIEIDAYLPEEG